MYHLPFSEGDTPEKMGLAPLVDKLYDGSFTADEMQKLSDTIANLAEVAKDSVKH